jgi:predicted Zn-dependent protease
MPFAWPLDRWSDAGGATTASGLPRYFVAIRAVQPKRSGDDKVLRNVIAHELGHTLGLTHHRATATLMCGPCSSLAAEDNPQEWLPLTAADRERLRALHAAQ